MFSYSYFSVSSKDKGGSIHNHTQPFIIFPNHVLDLLGDLVRHHVHLLAGHHLNKYLSSAQSPVPTLHSRKSETMTNQPTYQLTGVGARDAFTPKNKEKCVLKALKLEH